MSCLHSQLDALLKTTCMIREPWSRPSVNILSFPFYILNAPWLTARKQNAVRELKTHGIYDITTVQCGNREDLSNISCIYEPRLGINALGTVSLAVKHLLAARDAQLRFLPAAAIVEDDIQLIPHFHQSFSECMSRLPDDARLFHFASYRVDRHQLKDVIHKKSHVPKTNLVRRTNETVYIGAAGYVVFASYLDEILVPLKGAYDIHFSSQAKLRSPQPTYGSRTWLGGQSRTFKGGTHIERNGTHIERNGTHTERNGTHT